MILFCTDFLHEARNAERCREHLKHLDYVLIPKVHWDTTKKVNFHFYQLNRIHTIDVFFQRILTYDFIDGIAVDQIDELKKLNLSLKDVSLLTYD